MTATSFCVTDKLYQFYSFHECPNKNVSIRVFQPSIIGVFPTVGFGPIIRQCAFNYFTRFCMMRSRRVSPGEYSLVWLLQQTLYFHIFLTLSHLNWIILNCKMGIISIFFLQINHTWSHYNRLSETIQMSTHHVWFGAKMKDLSQIFV